MWQVTQSSSSFRKYFGLLTQIVYKVSIFLLKDKKLYLPSRHLPTQS